MKLKKLFASVLALLLCLSMMLSFVACEVADDSDDDRSSGSAKTDTTLYVASGTKDIPEVDSRKWKSAKDTPICKDITWEPGYIHMEHVKLQGSAKKSYAYSLYFDSDDDIGLLGDVIDVYMIPEGQEFNGLDDLDSLIPLGALSALMENNIHFFAYKLNKESDPYTFTLVFTMNLAASNEYQGLDFESDLYINYKKSNIDSDFPDEETDNKSPLETNPWDTDWEEPTETAPETIPEILPENIEKKYYDDEFYMSIMTDSNPMYCFWVEESQGDMMSEVIYARQAKVYDYLGVNVIAKDAGNYASYTNDFKVAVKNKYGSVDTLLTHVTSGITGLIEGMYLQDFRDIPGIDLEQDYWNMDFMESLSIADNYYLGFSDFNMLYTYVIAFNKDMLNQLSLDGYSEDKLYESVFNGTWTLDRFLDLGQKGFQEKGDRDIYGIVGQQWVPFVGFLHASNINYVEMDETGTYKLALMNDTYKEKTTALVDKLKSYSASGYGQFTFPSSGYISSPDARITDNRALMQLSSTYTLESYLDYDLSFGVLPYPLYDTDQYDANSDSLGYRSLQWGGYLAVPAYLRNEQMAGETLELLAFYSEPVRITFYEKLLGRQIAESLNDAMVLEIVWNSVCTDFGQTYNDEVDILYLIPNVTWPGEGGKELVPYYTSVKPAGNKKLAQFVKIVEKLSGAQ